MATFDPLLLASWCDGQWTQVPPHALKGFCHDSRCISPEQMFVCIPTESNDGHQFIADAMQRGSAAALVNHPCGASIPQLVVKNTLKAFQSIAREYRKHYKSPVIGITGSAGKTSSKELLRCLLGKESTHATSANFNNHIGVPLTLTALEPHFSFAVLEAGINNVGEMDVLADMIRPDVAIITSVFPVHLEGLQDSLEVVAAEKIKLAHSASRVVFPSDCLGFKPFKDLVTSYWVLAPLGEMLSTNAAHVWHYHFEPQSSTETELLLTPPGVKNPLSFRVGRWSRGMVRNAALCLIVAMELGMPVEALQQRLREWQPAEYRGQVIFREKKVFYADCYNSNPMALLDRVEAFQNDSDPQKPRLYILGGMGELGKDSAHYHRDVGSRIHLRPTDSAIIVGDLAQPLAEGLLEAGNKPNQVTWVPAVSDVPILIRDFEGSILIKASKRYHFWTLLES